MIMDGYQKSKGIYIYTNKSLAPTITWHPNQSQASVSTDEGDGDSIAYSQETEVFWP
ncbi:hypothetical protein J31TS6_46130 [Brevibacillus reuszeri]|nr:hypothetical protein J31TS6_46130 [Brevibacillus reuszeri]